MRGLRIRSGIRMRDGHSYAKLGVPKDLYSINTIHLNQWTLQIPLNL